MFTQHSFAAKTSVASTLLFGGFVFCAGCQEQAPSVAAVPIAVDWEHLRTECWRYTQLGDPESFYLTFNPNGIATGGIEVKKSDRIVGQPIAAPWFIDGTGRLIFGAAGDPLMKLRLLALSHNEATIVDDAKQSGKLKFTRRYIPRDQ